jgi:hypothetical protein
MYKPFFPMLKTLKEFEEWVNKMPAKMSFLQTEVYESREMDYSLESLDYLTKWLIQKYASFEVARNDEGIYLTDAAGRYVGETFRKRFSGIWMVELNKELISYGYPGIIRFTTSKYENETIHPQTWVTVTLDRQSPFIINRFNAHENRSQF